MSRLEMTDRCGGPSITCAIRSATPGDTIIVGPGRYRDLNNSGVLGDATGEERNCPQGRAHWGNSGQGREKASESKCEKGDLNPTLLTKILKVSRLRSRQRSIRVGRLPPAPDLWK